MGQINRHRKDVNWAGIEKIETGDSLLFALESLTYFLRISIVFLDV